MLEKGYIPSIEDRRGSAAILCPVFSEPGPGLPSHHSDH